MAPPNFSFSIAIVPVRSVVKLAWKKYNLNSRTVACAPAIIAGHDIGRIIMAIEP